MCFDEKRFAVHNVGCKSSTKCSDFIAVKALRYVEIEVPLGEAH